MKAILAATMITGLIMCCMDSTNFQAMLWCTVGGLCLFAGSAWLLTRGIK